MGSYLTHCELKSRVTQLSCNRIVTQTTKDLQRLNVIVRKGGKQQKLQVEKLRNDFKEAVQQYSRLQQQVAEKIKIRLFVRQQSSGYCEEDEQQHLVEQEAIAAQKTLQNELQFEQEMLLEREQRIKQIEDDILDVNEIMRELGSMVHEQGETINSIENNLENVHANVEQGQEELEKAAQYQINLKFMEGLDEVPTEIVLPGGPGDCGWYSFDNNNCDTIEVAILMKFLLLCYVNLTPD
ncbi:Uncharacterized protein GBIM_07266 [Gryllus bimaculatus]|nr:Uncharacterized protein GBIM_07266 [Gryllus bimaculatus]